MKRILLVAAVLALSACARGPSNVKVAVSDGQATAVVKPGPVNLNVFYSPKPETGELRIDALTLTWPKSVTGGATYSADITTSDDGTRTWLVVERKEVQP